MTYIKSLKFAAMTCVLFSAIAAQPVFADTISRADRDGPNCGTMSFDDPSCNAYVKPSAKAVTKPPVLVRADGDGANCGTMSFDDPSCNAYVKPSTEAVTKPSVLVRADGDGANCGTMSFNDPNCHAYIGH